jgi:hypothetical protein
MHARTAAAHFLRRNSGQVKVFCPQEGSTIVYMLQAGGRLQVWKFPLPVNCIPFGVWEQHFKLRREILFSVTNAHAQ